MKQPEVNPYKTTTIMKPTDKTKPTLPLAAALVCLLAVGCEKPKPGPSPEPTPDPITVLDTLPPDTVWVSPPYDTAAALEGRVWRSESTWWEWQHGDTWVQRQLHGYSLTTTLLYDNYFKAEVAQSSTTHYLSYFEIGEAIYRYVYYPQLDGVDSTLVVIPADAPAEADSMECDWRQGCFTIGLRADSLVFMRYYLGFPDGENIYGFFFKKIKP